jgi:hypothetical protein
MQQVFRLSIAFNVEHLSINFYRTSQFQNDHASLILRCFDGAVRRINTNIRVAVDHSSISNKLEQGSRFSSVGRSCVSAPEY